MQNEDGLENKDKTVITETMDRILNLDWVEKEMLWPQCVYYVLHKPYVIIGIIGIFYMSFQCFMTGGLLAALLLLGMAFVVWQIGCFFCYMIDIVTYELMYGKSLPYGDGYINYRNAIKQNFRAECRHAAMAAVIKKAFRELLCTNPDIQPEELSEYFGNHKKDMDELRWKFGMKEDQIADIFKRVKSRA